MKMSLKPILTVVMTTFFTVSLAQSNTSALVPMPNSIEINEKRATTELDGNTTITTSLPENDFLLQELKKITEKHLHISPVVDNSKKRTG